MSETVLDLPTWDLSDLYEGVDDPRIEADLEASLERARRFEERFRGRIAVPDLKARTLREALDEYEALQRQSGRPQSFAGLLYATDTTDARRGALVQRTQEVGSRIATHLLFFDLEIGRIPDERWALLAPEADLADYRHYLEYQRLVARYCLSEAEEKVLEETANCRGRAFRRLFTELVSRLKYSVELDGETRELTQSELMALLYDPDREIRRKASESLGRTLERNAHPVHFTFNTLLLEKQVMDRLRGFERPEQSRNLDNEIPDAAVDTMVGVAVAHYDLVARYYRLKRDLLGLDRLWHYDRYAPLLPDKQHVPFEEAREIVLGAFQQFHPRFAELAEPFFSQRWIDAALAPGKRGGAFCAGVTPDVHPYVLMNYTGRPRDVMTLAHELGHGVHDRLAGRQNLLNYHPVLPLAETASTFAELLVFEKLQGSLQTPRERLALLAEKLEDTFATVFRQISMYRFEQRAHNLRRERGELDVETLNTLWQETLQEMFGDSLTLGEDHRWTWLYVPHFVQTPFYVYAYAFGELLVLSLYARYRQEGPSFHDRYFELLAAGGSRPPAELLEELGIDITQASFWEGGCALVRQKVEEAEALAARVGALRD